MKRESGVGERGGREDGAKGGKEGEGKRKGIERNGKEERERAIHRKEESVVHSIYSMNGRVCHQQLCFRVILSFY